MKNLKSIERKYPKIWYITMSYTDAIKLGLVFDKFNRYIKVWETKDIAALGTKSHKYGYLGNYREVPKNNKLFDILKAHDYGLKITKKLVHASTAKFFMKIEIRIKVQKNTTGTITMKFGGIDLDDVTNKYFIIHNELNRLKIPHKITGEKEKNNCNTLESL